MFSLRFVIGQTDIYMQMHATHVDVISTEIQNPTNKKLMLMRYFEEEHIRRKNTRYFWKKLFQKQHYKLELTDSNLKPHEFQNKSNEIAIFCMTNLTENYKIIRAKKQYGQKLSILVSTQSTAVLLKMKYDQIKCLERTKDGWK